MDIVPSHYPIRSREQSKSVGQFNLGCQIKSIYGQAVILEEFPIPETRLSLDFYMPQHGLAFEFQGEQHDRYIQHFHRDRSGFEKQIRRDSQKRKWCNLNSIRLIEIRTSAITVDELKELIQNNGK